MISIFAWTQLILGIVTFILGIVDVGWTAGNYSKMSCKVVSTSWNVGLRTPCEQDTMEDESLVWTWVSSSIWGSFFIVITGVVGSRITPYNTENLRFHRDLFTVLCILVCLLWGPAIIVLQALEVYYSQGVFYFMQAGSMLPTMGDQVKFILPIIIACFTFISWIAALAGVGTGCCCAPLPDSDEYGSGRRLKPSSEIEVIRERRHRYEEDRRPRYDDYDDDYDYGRSVVPYGRERNVMGPPIVMPPGGGYSNYGYSTYGGGYPSAGYTQTPYGHYGGAYGGGNYVYESSYPQYATYGGATASPYF
jgi:hypothetical protein